MSSSAHNYVIQPNCILPYIFLASGTMGKDITKMVRLHRLDSLVGRAHVKKTGFGSNPALVKFSFFNIKSLLTLQLIQKRNTFNFNVISHY